MRASSLVSCMLRALSTGALTLCLQPSFETLGGGSKLLQGNSTGLHRRARQTSTGPRRLIRQTCRTSSRFPAP